MRAMTDVTVAELRHAWQAIRAGSFTQGEGSLACLPDEPVIPILGAQGQSGASTLAVAMASVAAPARVVECAPAGASGLVAASTAELGATGDGSWLRGTRGDVLIDRHAGSAMNPVGVPPPNDSDRAVRLTVVDVGWPPAQVLNGSSWLSRLVREACQAVICSVATVPGLGRLEATLALLPDLVCVAVVLGPQTRRWPRQVSASAGPLTSGLLADQRVLTVPEVPELRISGVTADRLPRAVLAAAAEVLRAVELPVPTPISKDES